MMGKRSPLSHGVGLLVGHNPHLWAGAGVWERGCAPVSWGRPGGGGCVLLTGERCGKYICKGLQGWAGAYLGPRGEGLARVPGSSGLVGAVDEDWRCFVV